MSPLPVLQLAALPGEGLTLSTHLDEDDVSHEDAVWKSSYVNNLPDSAFGYVEPGGSKDSEGKTIPRSLRHFPYKDDTGAVDLVHVRDAIGRIPQSNVPSAVKARVQEKMRGILAESHKTDSVTRNESIKLDGSKMKRTPQGGIRGPAAVTRVGVFRYKHNDGPMAGKVVREYRPAEEVFHPDSLATLDQAPITDYHPTDNGGLVAPENFTKLAKGTITDVKHDATHVLADAVIQDATVAKAVLRGERIELSAGYVSRMDWTPGTFNGQPYDVVQRNIRYNHVALLPRGGGRQGPDVALRFDAAILPEAMIIHFDGKDFDMGDEAQRKAYDLAVQAKANAAVTAEKTRADKAEARADAADAELAPMKAAKVQAARTALETQARKIMGAKAPAAFTGTDRDVRALAVGIDCTGKSDDYVLARFDSLVEAPAAPAPDTALEAARAAMQPAGVQLTENAPTPAPWTQRWRQPLTATKDK